MIETIRIRRGKQRNGVLVHLILWGVICILPYFLMDSDTLFNWKHFLRSMPDLLAYLLVFYVNYLFLVDSFLFNRRPNVFVITNVILIVGISFLMHYGRVAMGELYPELWTHRRPMMSIKLLPLLRNGTSLFLIFGLSLALKLMHRWLEVENERKELAKAKSEAELQNMKNQISPHFLLNTLNNIYALIEFDPPKAQTAVVELSKLLRHLLYDNQDKYVPLHQDADFILNYIELMRLRLPEHVQVSTQINVPESSDTSISPFIFISLVENAFKHGVSPDKPSFVDIRLSELDNKRVEFECRNSYYPKTTSDKSGSGIGLNLVKSRLEMMYPGRYTWNTSKDDNVYVTKLVINTLKNEKP